MYAVGANRELLLGRWANALELLARYAPRYLAWLGRAKVRFTILPAGKRLVSVWLAADTVNVHPRLVWALSAEELASEVASVAYRVRVQVAGLGEWGEYRSRMVRSAMHESLVFARRLPSGAPLVARWEEKLAHFDMVSPDIRLSEIKQAAV